MGAEIGHELFVRGGSEPAAPLQTGEEFAVVDHDGGQPRLGQARLGAKIRRVR